jgi:hypothetical protein
MQQAQIVLLGEASHGTHEFYHIRAELTQYLLKIRGLMLLLSKEIGQTRIRSMIIAWMTKVQQKLL